MPEQASKEGGRNGHGHIVVTEEERGFGTRRGGDDRGIDSRDRGQSPVKRDGRGDVYRNRDDGRYGDRVPGRDGRGALHGDRREELGRPHDERYGSGYSQGRRRHSPDRFRNGGAHSRGGGDDRERSLERYRNGGLHSRGERSPRRDARERSPEGARKRQRHDSSDEEGEDRQPLKSTGEGRGRNGETRKREETGRGGEERGRDVERRRDESPKKKPETMPVVKDRRRHDTPESDEDRKKEEGTLGENRENELEMHTGRNGNDRTGAAVKEEPQRDESEEPRDVRVKKEEASDGEGGAEPPEPERVSVRVKKEEADDSDDEPGKLKGYGLIPGRGGLQLPAKRPGDAPSVPYKKPEEPAKPVPRVRHVPGEQFALCGVQSTNGQVSVAIPKVLVVSAICSPRGS